MANALAKAGLYGENKLDILIFNQCLMGQIDVSYSMAPYARVMIASEDVIPGTSIRYVMPLSNLTKNPGMNEKQLAEQIVNSYRKYYTEEQPIKFTTLAAYDLDKMPDVANSTKNLCSVLKEQTEENWPQIGIGISFSESFWNYRGLASFKLQSNYYDLLDFANLVNIQATNPEVSLAVSDLKEAMDRALIAEYHGELHPFAYGLSIYFPEDESLYSKDYINASEFARVTGWDEFLKGYLAGETTDKIAPSIEIDSALPQPSNISNPITIIGNATGNNIAGFYRLIGINLKDNKVLIINDHPLYRYYINYSGDRRLPEFRDGRNNIDFTWAPVTDVLTNGQESIYAPAFQNGEHEYLFEVVGYYKGKNESENYLANLIFDGRTGTLAYAQKKQNNFTQDFKPQVGDIFTPLFRIHDINKRKINSTLGSNITIRNCGLWLEPYLMPNGEYKVGLVVQDLSGNYDLEWANVTISGQPAPNPNISAQDLAGIWRGYGPYENTEFVYEFSGEAIPKITWMSHGCDDWHKCHTTINTTGKKEKRAISAYLLRIVNGYPLMTLLLFPEGSSEPIYMHFFVDIREDTLYMTDIYQGGKYILTKHETNLALREKEECDEALIGSWVNDLGNIFFYRDGSYIWEIGDNKEAGTFSTSAGKLYLTSNRIRTTYSYVVTDGTAPTLEIIDQRGTALSYSKYDEASSQSESTIDFSGKWEGKLYQPGAMYPLPQEYQFYLDLTQFGTHVWGTAMVAFDSYYAIIDVSGRESDGTTSLKEASVIKQNPPIFMQFLRKAMTLRGEGENPSYLSGYWNCADMLCNAEGTISLWKL